MGTEFDVEAIREGLRGQREPVELTLHPDEDESELFGKFVELADTIAAAAPEVVVVRRGADATLPARPGLTLACGERGGIHYLALPDGQEAAPFVQAVLTVASGADGAAAHWSPRLSELAEPAELLVFAAASCPHCPQAVSAANLIAVASPLVRSVIVDVQRYPELAARFHVKSVPLTVMDGGLSLTGVVPAAQLVTHLLDRGKAELEALVLASLVNVGRLDETARRLREPRGPAAFAAVWRGSTTSSRMGLLLAVEQVLDDAPAALDGAVEGLLPALQAEDAALQGDTADLLGRIGHPAARPGLRSLLTHPNPDVAEIAGEALEELRSDSEA